MNNQTLVSLVLTLIGWQSGAVCSINEDGQPGVAGEIEYFNSTNALRYCDGVNWKEMTDPSFNINLSYESTAGCGSTYCGGELDKRIIFVSTSSLTGRLGGVTGADKICQSFAEQAGLLGQYNALLADSIASYRPENRFERSTYPYYLPDGTKVADNWTDLSDGNIDNPINGLADGTTASSGDGNVVWANLTNTLLYRNTDHCSDWNSDSSGQNGNVGSMSATGGFAFNQTTLSPESCDSLSRLYCVEQRYIPGSVEFDGDDRVRSPASASIANDKEITVSLWFRTNGPNNTGAGGLFKLGTFFIQFVSTGGLSFQANNSGGTEILAMYAGDYDDGNWHHLLFSVDLSSSAHRHVYIDDKVAVTQDIAFTNDIIDFSGAVSIGAFESGGNPFFGEIGEVWADTGTYMDLSDVSNRRLFITSNLLPRFLGPAGAGPLNTSPDFYFTGRTVSEFQINKGVAVDVSTTVGDPQMGPPLLPDISYGLAGHWKLDETSGTSAIDSSGNGYNGTVNGTNFSTASVAGRNGTAFDSVAGGRVDITDQIELSGGTGKNRSWAAWLKPNSNRSGTQTFFDKSPDAANKDFRLRLVAGGQLRFYYETGAIDTPCPCDSTATLVDNVWNHVAATYESKAKRLTLYINGVLDQSFTLQNDPPDTVTGPRIGGSTYLGLASEFEGDIDDVRIYQRVLLPEEVVNLATLSLTTLSLGDGPHSNKVLHFNFEETSGTVIADDGVASDGTLEDTTMATVSTEGVNGTLGIDFDGFQDVIRVSDFLGSEIALSFSMWLKPQAWSSSNSYTCIIGQGIGVDSVFDVQRLRDSNEMQFSVHNSSGASREVTLPELSTGGWHHLAGSWDGQDVRFYHNGVLKSKGSLTGTLEDSSNIFEIGDCWTAGTYPTGNWNGMEYDGDMDDLRVYNRALSSSEIIQLYQFSKPGIQTLAQGPVNGLIGHWPMKETSGSTATNQGSMGSSADGVYEAIGSINQRIFGPRGGGSEFEDSSDRRVIIPDILGAETSLSIALWFQVDDYPAPNGSLVAFSQSVNSSLDDSVFALQFHSQYTQMRFVLRESGNSAGIAVVDLPPTQLWHHMAGTWDGATMKLYLNGIEVDSVPFAGNLIASSNVLSIGARWEAGIHPSGALDNRFDGKLEDVRLYNRALTPDEVRLLFTGSNNSVACGRPGQMRYNQGAKIYEYCNGSTWRGTAGTNMEGSSCSGSTNQEGKINYESGNLVFCNGNGNVEINP